MKKSFLPFLIIFFLISKINNAQTQFNCGTEIPSQQWEAQLQTFINDYKASNLQGKAEVANFIIPVIIHVIHGGQAIGTFPNLAQGQINSQIQVLNNDYAGIGFNNGNYPANAFVNYAIAQNIPQANLDANGRIKIANCNVQFCLAVKDTLGNILAEPGIDRINYVNKGWTNPASFTTNNALKNYTDATIKPGSIWNVTKYLNIWLSPANNAVTLLGYATFPPLAGITGLSAPYGSSISDGFWCVADAFGTSSIFPGGTYKQGYTRGRTSTHEIGHYLGLRHTWGDGT